MAQTLYLSEVEIIAVNEKMISRYGGLHGVKDLNMLQLAVGRPQMSVGFQDAYKSSFDKAAALMHSIINNHPFLDGNKQSFSTNKRTSFFGAILFLEYNGWTLKFKSKEGVKFAKRVHDHDWNVEQIAQWFKDHAIKARR